MMFSWTGLAPWDFEFPSFQTLHPNSQTLKKVDLPFCGFFISKLLGKHNYLDELPSLDPALHKYPPLSTQHQTPNNLHPTPYTLHPTPYTLHPTPYTPHRYRLCKVAQNRLCKVARLCCWASTTT